MRAVQASVAGRSWRGLGGVLVVTLSVPLHAGPSGSDQAYFSARGEITVVGGQHLFGFELDRAVADTEDLRFATYGATTGTTNAAGDAIPSASYDGFLDLDRSGVGDVATNDDGGPSVDALLSWPGVADSGGALPAGSVPADTYLLRLSEFSDNEANPWAGDVIGPADAVRLRNLVPSNEPSIPAGESRLDSLKFGTRLGPGQAVLGTTPAVFDYVGTNTLTINGELSVAHTGYGTLTASQGALTATGLTTVGAAGVVNLTGGDLNANAGLTLDSAALSPFPGAQVTVATGSTLAVNGNTTVNQGATLTATAGTLDANGNITAAAGTLNAAVTGFNGDNVLAAGATLLATNGAQVTTSGGRLDVNDGATVTVNADADYTHSGGILIVAAGTVTVDGAGSTFNVPNQVVEVAPFGTTGILTLQNNATASLGQLQMGRSLSTASTNGTVDILTGADLSTDSILIANIDGNEGSTAVNITGAGSTLVVNSGGFITLGNANTANNPASHTINIDDGTLTTGTGVTTINQTGTIEVFNDGNFNVNGDVVLNGGTFRKSSIGDLNLAAGVTVTANDDAFFRFNAGYTVNNGNTFNLNSGSDLTAGGLLSIWDGTVNVDGNGSSFLSSGFSDIGFLGTGELNLRNGALGTVFGKPRIGDGSSSSSQGFVRVESGSTFRARGVDIGTGTGGTGTMLVTGIDSTVDINNTNGVDIGAAAGATGTGTLTIADGAIFNAGNSAVTVHATGTLNVEATFVNSGGIGFNPAKLVLNEDLTVELGGLVTGNGIIEAEPSSAATFTNRGTLRLQTLFASETTPGSSIAASFSTEFRVPYVQEAGGVMEVGRSTLVTGDDEPSFDQLFATEAYTLAGELRFVLDENLDPSANFDFASLYGDTQSIVLGGSRTGVFDTVAGHVFGNGTALAVLYDSGDVIAQRVLYGDANRNRLVEQGDLNAVLNNWGQSNLGGSNDDVSWASGDLNGNGLVEQGDLNAVLNNWGGTAAPDFSGFNVPEPAAALCLVVLTSGTVRRRAI